MRGKYRTGIHLVTYIKAFAGLIPVQEHLYIGLKIKFVQKIKNIDVFNL